MRRGIRAEMPADYVRRDQRVYPADDYHWVPVAITYAIAGIVVGSLSVYLFMA